MGNLSKNTLKYLQSLQTKKKRAELGCFCVEGSKSVEEVFASDFETIGLYATEEFISGHLALIREKDIKTEVASAEDLAKAGSFKTNGSAIAVVSIREHEPPTEVKGLVLALDGINDPGNLGAILRVADWYGVREIVCSQTTVGLYNPKVIAASKGSFLRTKVSYADIGHWLRDCQVPAIGADGAGQSARDFQFPADMVLVIGGEAHGLSPEVAELLSGTVAIPGDGHTESLNAAVATGILLDNIVRLRK